MRTDLMYKTYGDGKQYFACPMCDSPHTWEELSPQVCVIAGQTNYSLKCEHCSRVWLWGFEHVTLHPIYECS